MKDVWDAKIYSRFLELRTRPARDLLAAIPTIFQPSVVYDLGCGPGNSTVLLKNRWPSAHVVGLDTSPDMLKEANHSYPDIQFVQGDIANFSPPEKVDCLFANASLQWLDDHTTLFPKLLQSITSGGVFAIQLPNNFHVPSHQAAIRILQAQENWQPLLKKLFFGVLTKPLYYLPWYYDLCIKSGATLLSLWETEYFQEMSTHQEILTWVTGTGLRPVLSVMTASDQDKFSAMYIDAMTKAYPAQVNGKILFSYRRIFIVGYKK